MAVIELNLLNSQNEFSQMGEHFQDEHNLQKFSPKWESALPFGRKSPKLSVRPYWPVLRFIPRFRQSSPGAKLHYQYH